MELLIIAVFLIFGLSAFGVAVSGTLTALELLNIRIFPDVSFKPVALVSVGVFILSLLALVLINVFH